MIDFKITEDTVTKALNDKEKKIVELRGDVLKECVRIARAKITGRTPKRTGRLRESIQGGKPESIEKYHIAVDNAYVDFGTSVPYANYVENGTSRQRAQRYFYRGMKASERDIYKLVEVRTRLIVNMRY